MSRPRPAWRAVVIIGVLAVTLAWLNSIGRGSLATPPLSPRGAYAWLEQRDTTIAAFEILRLVGMLASAYLLAVFSASLLARTVRSAALARVVDRCTLRWARGIVGGVALFGVMTTPPPTSSPSDPLVGLPPTGEVATLTELPNVPTAPEAPPDASRPETSTDRTSADTWTVEHGDSFWSISLEVLADEHDGAVSDRDIVEYWQRVIDANRDRLVNPDDPDLLFAGQELVLPAVVSAP